MKNSSFGTHYKLKTKMFGMVGYLLNRRNIGVFLSSMVTVSSIILHPCRKLKRKQKITYRKVLYLIKFYYIKCQFEKN